MVYFRRTSGVLILLLAAAFAGATGVTQIRATRTVTDGTGRSVELPASLDRVVIAGSAALMVADAYYLFPPAQDRLVGVTRIDQGRGNFLESIDPRYGEKVVIEGNVGAEQIAALKPDVVLMKSVMADSLGSALARLEIAVFYVDLETPEQYRRDLAVIGDLLGEPARATVMIEYYRQVTQLVTSVTAVLEASERPDTLFLYARLSGGTAAFNIPPAGWIQTTMVEMAGGDPVWAAENATGGWRTIGFEQIAAWNPEAIFVVAYREDADALIERLRGEPRWQELEAVREGRIAAFPVDYYSWDQPDVRWALGLQWLAKRLHPSRFASLDLAEATYRFFSLAYGMSEAQVDEVVMPLLGNALR